MRAFSFKQAWFAVILATVAACQMPSGAPTVAHVEAEIDENQNLRLVTVGIEQTRILQAMKFQRGSRSSFFASGSGTFGKFAPGDTINVTVIERASGGLFSQTANLEIGTGGSRITTLPPMQVSKTGQIDFPYLGILQASGLDELELGQLLSEKLSAQSPSPNVVVNRIPGRSNTVLVLGDVKVPGEIALTSAEETVLQAIASAKGNVNPPSDTLVRLTRGGASRTIRLSKLMRKPGKGVRLRQGDRITLEYDPQKYTILGASGVRLTKPLPASGFSLADALGTGGGLNDNLADPSGVFVLRYENNEVLKRLGVEPTDDGPTTPTVFQFDISGVGGLLAATKFPLVSEDIILISNASAVGVRKFVTIFASAASAGNTTRSIFE